MFIENDKFTTTFIIHNFIKISSILIIKQFASVITIFFVEITFVHFWKEYFLD
jgi:hypothetical protein